MELSKTYLKDLVYQINGAAIEVHKNLGPGLLEKIYHKCLEKELAIKNFDFHSEYSVPINYKGLEIEIDLRCDLFIENCLIVELKSVEKVMPIHEAQLLTYMKLLNVPMGLMINFNVTNIYKEGQKTYVNDLFRKLEE
ncbi:GxxExxY protein [Flavobacterium sp.]|uniref:GxxExxY protein n=1 Tax=Flavobacterium sp. TaxID=239 RepID=UPI00248A89E9|nr:GxxExxY protein [Flavobacterium sp.]MDI1316844.1 GxxExxY protein [Flavobacterium sp.]